MCKTNIYLLSHTEREKVKRNWDKQTSTQSLLVHIKFYKVYIPVSWNIQIPRLSVIIVGLIN